MEANMNNQKCCPHCGSENKITARSTEEIKALESRINRIIGQLNGVKNMISENRYCADVLLQLSAVSSAVKSLSSIIMEDHLSGCVTQKLKDGDEAVINEVVEIFKRFS
jgi:DNA-binding FrmR family transcriptional regulator